MDAAQRVEHESTELDEEQPAPRDVIDDPEVQAKIKAALERAEQGQSNRGMTADDLLRLAREQRGVDA